ncbi:hypothetical protein QYE76_026076 [Lolium multiflorum]|uniref:RNase H type-1 domain-containing protein n=1 Tax=Lolium multiflorum TaxID=4521 RepID=A0AAD8RI16_LOLMU|nr:hypothetical protein QYE76_026076 [Lolium multiflorum]
MRWKEDLVWNTFQQIDADIILKIKPSRRQANDVLAWQPEKSGSFSVRSAYKLALNELPDQCSFPTTSAHPGGDDPCWPVIWKSLVPPKVKIFAWKAVRNALATEANKKQWGMNVTGSKRFMCGYLNIISNVKYHSTEDIIKGKRDIDPDKSPPQQASPLSAKRWTKPPPGWVKLSCDGSVKTEDGTAGAGMVLRDEYGEVIFSACRQLLACDDPFEAEAYACEDGLRLALEWSEKPIIVESDCSTLISAVQATTQDRSQFMHLLYEIKLLVNVSRIVSFVKVDRSQLGLVTASQTLREQKLELIFG